MTYLTVLGGQSSCLNLFSEYLFKLRVGFHVQGIKGVGKPV